MCTVGGEDKPFCCLGFFWSDCTRIIVWNKTTFGHARSPGPYGCVCVCVCIISFYRVIRKRKKKIICPTDHFTASDGYCTRAYYCYKHSVVAARLWYDMCAPTGVQVYLTIIDNILCTVMSRTSAGMTRLASAAIPFTRYVRCAHNMILFANDSELPTLIIASFPRRTCLYTRSNIIKFPTQNNQLPSTETY